MKIDNFKFSSSTNRLSLFPTRFPTSLFGRSRSGFGLCLLLGDSCSAPRPLSDGFLIGAVIVGVVLIVYLFEDVSFPLAQRLYVLLLLAQLELLLHLGVSFHALVERPAIQLQA